MQSVSLILLLGAAWPIGIAWRATATTTLRHSLAWAIAAWAAWLLALAAETDLAAYLALCLSSCAGVAVLGARRPGVGAWNFVLAGLLAVLLLPVAQGLGTLRVETAQLIFLGATLIVPVFNYLPTRLSLAMLLCGLGCAVELARLNGVFLLPWQETAARICLALSPWAGLLARRNREARSAFDRAWFRYRDSFGFLSAQRARTVQPCREECGLGAALDMARSHTDGSRCDTFGGGIAEHAIRGAEAFRGIENSYLFSRDPIGERGPPDARAPLSGRG